MSRLAHPVCVLAGAASLLACAAACAAEGTTPAADQPAQETRAPTRLDLRPPDIRHVLSTSQIQELLAKTADGSIEEVEVYGDGERKIPLTPRVWPGIAAPFWALAHPLQAWRIIAPLPPDQSREIGDNNIDTRDPYLKPAAVSR